MTTKVSTI